MRKIISNTLLLFLMWTTNVCAQPTITDVDGVVSDGSTITITGNNFGINGPTIVIFDDFEKGSNGSIISTASGSAQVNNWTQTESSPDHPKYSSDQHFSGSLSMLSDQSTSDGGHWSAVSFADNTRVYVSFWVMLPTGKVVPGTSGIGANWKLADVNAGTISSPSSQYTATVTIEDLPINEGALQSPGAWYGTSGLTDGGWISESSSWIKNRWHRFEVYYVGSTSNSGSDYLWEMNSSNPKKSLWYQTGMTNLQSYDSAGWGLFRLHSYARDDSLGQCYYDDVYVATGSGARARVEIGNSSVYSDCTNLAIITPTSWSSTSISATVRRGSFAADATAYLFVVDSSGIASSGYAITFGSGGDTTAPSVSITGVSGRFKAN